eukprot:15365692-Ditylum_brightwellii.AAC.1
MKDLMRQCYPDALDLPCNSEIRTAITRLMQQQKNKKALNLAARQCGQKSNQPFVPILVYVSSKILVYKLTIKPKEVAQHSKDLCAEYDTLYPVSPDRFPSDDNARRKIGALKTKAKKTKGSDFSNAKIYNFQTAVTCSILSSL